MPTPGRPVLSSTGRPSVRSGGRSLVFDAAGECAECCGGGGNPGIACCNPLDNCGFTESQTASFSITSSIEVTNAIEWQTEPGYRFPADTLSFGHAATVTLNRGQQCRYANPADELVTKDGLFHCTPDPSPNLTDWHHWEHSGFTWNPLVGSGSSFPVGPQVISTLSRILTSYPSGQRPQDNKLVTFSMNLAPGQDRPCDGSTDVYNTYSPIYGISAAFLVDLITGKWACSVVASQSVVFADNVVFSPSATVTILRGNGGCATGARAVLTWTLTGSRDDGSIYDGAYSISGTVTIELEGLTIGPCTSGESAAGDCGCGCGGTCD